MRRGRLGIKRLGKMRIWGRNGILFAVILVLLSGCGAGSGVATSGAGSGGGSSAGGADGGKQAVKVSTDPVTIRMFQSSTRITDEQFNDLIVDPVKKKYPYISMELIRSSPTAKAEELVAAGDFPDMIFTGLGSVVSYRKLGLLTDLTPQIKKFNFPIDNFEPRIINQVKVYGEKGELYAVPYLENFSALFYNKDIFDKYGVPYPKDNMMWPDVIKLGKQISGKTAGEMPLCPGSFTQFISPMSMAEVDAKTNKASIESDKWKMALQMFTEIQQIPGNACKGDGKEVTEFEAGNIAMIASNGARLGEFEEMLHQGVTMNWDLATYPQFKEAPGKRRRMDITLLMVSATSKHPDQAFQVIDAISARDQQVKRTRLGNLSTFKDPALKKDYAVDFKASKGKNIQGIFKTEPSAMFPYSEYNGIVNKYLNAAVKDAAKGIDVNTALRTAADKANQDIAAAVQGQ
ncbi:MAG: extracellular solute-binding protein family 1 [Paenibacillaceae bacterium]|nr:extracellular solute-binding protein family 1 [Paenibacillaceae bacterium]